MKGLPEYGPPYGWQYPSVEEWDELVKSYPHLGVNYPPVVPSEAAIEHNRRARAHVEALAATKREQRLNGVQDDDEEERAARLAAYIEERRRA